MSQDNTPNASSSQAVALHYDGKNAPTITASGNYSVAEEILAIAMACEVPIYENPELAEVLGQMELGDSIPESLYLAIAEVIAFAYYINGKTPADLA